MRNWKSTFVAAAAIGIAACAPAETPPNILLITLDTTRADRLGSYGHAAASTPALDALADTGLRFEHASAQAPLTLASHASLLSGTYPRETGVQVNGGGRLPDGVPTLAEQLRAEGYATAAFVSAFVLDGVFGLDRGFDVYDDDLAAAGESSAFVTERPADQVTNAALTWLDGLATEAPFLAWVHYFDPHSPYAPPGDYRGRFDDPYDGELAFVDDQLARLVSWLDERGLRERTLIVVAGDHGESFGEHDEPEHGLLVYDTTTRVPLILNWRGRLPAGAVVTERVQLVDLYSTLLEVGGAPDDPQAAGHSLMAALDGAALAPRVIYGESRYGQIGYGWAPLRFVIESSLKYIEAPEAELYDLTADPGELQNLVTEDPDRAGRLRDTLLALERDRPLRAVVEADLSSEQLEAIRALGYVAAGGSGTATDDISDLADPKTMLSVYREHVRVNELLAEGHLSDALVLLQSLIVQTPESYDLYEDLGWVYLGLDRSADAEQAYRTSLTLLPDHAERLWGLGEALRRQNRFDEAITAYERSIERRPAFGEPHMGLTAIYVARGQFEPALRHARRQVEINPATTVGLANVANLSMSLERYDDAAAAAERLLAISPTDRDAHGLLWQAHHRAGRRDEALAALRSAQQTLGEDWEMLTSLAWLLSVTPGSTSEETTEALEAALAAVKLRPQHPRSYDVLGAALANAGDFERAVRAALQALKLAADPRAASMRQAIEQRLRLYEEGTPYRQ